MNVAMHPGSIYSGVSEVRPMNYSLNNQSEVSSAFAESVQKSQGVDFQSYVNPVSPVRYPDMQTVSADPSERLAKTRSLSREWNEIASGFQGSVTGYGSDSRSYGYQMVGSTIDLYV